MRSRVGEAARAGARALGVHLASDGAGDLPSARAPHVIAESPRRFRVKEIDRLLGPRSPPSSSVRLAASSLANSHPGTKNKPTHPAELAGVAQLAMRRPHEHLRGGCFVVQSGMGSDGVVVTTPALDDDLRLAQGIEDLAIEQLVPEAALRLST